MGAALSPIEHVIVLMMENRSFDHIFGYRHGVQGLSGNESNLLNPAQPAGPNNPEFRVQNTAPFAVTSGIDVGHSLDQVNLQLFGTKTPKAGAKPNMSGFVAAYKSELASNHVQSPTPAELADPMLGFTSAQLPSLNALADAFCVCDNWRAEVPGPTHPNRLYLHAATSMGNARNVWSTPFNFKTIFEQVQDAGMTWGVYENDTDDEVRKFTRISSNKTAFRQYTNFASDITTGKLPNYSFILPRQMADKTGATMPNSMHAPEDVRYGDMFIADVYEAIRGTAAVWESSLFILVFDEHGGFYDHIPPGSATPPDNLTSPRPGDPSWVPSFSFDRMGLRVPALIISPYVAQQTYSAPLQHTSVMCTVRDLWRIKGNLTNRDKTAQSFAGLVQNNIVNTGPIRLPRIAPPPAAPANSPNHPANQVLDSTQMEHVLAVHHGTRSSFPKTTPNDLPRNQGEASDFIRTRYAKHLGKPPEGAPAPKSKSTPKPVLPKARAAKAR
jgi:phospholipase C